MLSGEGFVYLKFLLLGVRWTIGISLLAVVGGSVLGMIVALIRLSGVNILEKLASLYVDFFRTIPILVQLLWIYYAMPMLTGFSLNGISAGAIGLSLYSSSFLAEIIRAGILSIEKGQREAALALGMNSRQVMQRIIFPQAIVRMLPPITSVFVSLIKDSSLASLVGLPELMRQTNALSAYTLHRMEWLTVAGVMYFAINFPLSILINSFHKRRLSVGNSL